MENYIFCLPSFYKDRERLFKRRKVHIKSEFWKNAAITLSIKNLKGLWEIVLCQPYTALVLNIANADIYFLIFPLTLDSNFLPLPSKTTDCKSSSSSPEQDCLSADRGDFKKLLRFSLFCFHADLMTESRKTSGNIINNNLKSFNYGFIQSNTGIGRQGI